jgi:hypothetical protein
MKVTEMICSAMPWAASSVVPIQPIITMAPTKSPLSARSVSPMGQPRRKTAKKTGQSEPPEPLEKRVVRKPPRPGREEREHQRIRTCVPTEATAAPATPSSGAPRLPKIRTQLSERVQRRAPEPGPEHHARALQRREMRAQNEGQKRRQDANPAIRR